MSMFGSVQADFEAWRESSPNASNIESAIADDHDLVVREAFLAGAACVIGGTGKAKKADQGRSIERFLSSYRDQVDKKLREVGVVVGQKRPARKRVEVEITNRQDGELPEHLHAHVRGFHIKQRDQEFVTTVIEIELVGGESDGERVHIAVCPHCLQKLAAAAAIIESIYPNAFE